MRFENAFIPYGAYWSTPFAKWQGSLSGVHAIDLAAQATRRAFAERDLGPDRFDGVVLGTTVPQRHGMYGGPWLAALVGAESITGTIVSQACATGARALAAAASEVELAGERTVLSITTDRCSNGPHIYYPDPGGPGGTGAHEDWVLDSFGHDPWARNSMIETAERVAAEQKITRGEQDELTLRRYEQYRDALADGAAFLRRFMLWPFEVTDAKGRPRARLEGDEGVFPTTREGLAALRPVLPEGTVTYGSQTHPADGACGIVVASRARARELSRDGGREVQLLGYAQARTTKGFMAKATSPAAKAALEAAGVPLREVKVIKTHNPFAVNDLYLARELGRDAASFNNYGSSLIYGHPQAPTGSRLIIEAIEELSLAGGGHGLFVGCAAGDTAAAVVLRVG
jgi:acetyl-CoA acetyltransferase